ncbi:MAG: outer membrane beta-barrel protein, partial [Chitinophagaceae bacterium]|nr:outer membrane beta-barrel protein [Chitinophagaceae bacterium]
IVLTSSLSAQKLWVNAFAGLANYAGDLQGRPFTFSQAKFAYGAGVSYEVSERVFVRGGLTFGKVAADDKKNNKNTIRNLNFTSPLSEGHVAVEYYLVNLTEHSISPYIFAGVAVYGFNPYTHDTSGKKIFLKPLSTEGEGFYPNRQNYKLTQFAIPFGGGIKMALNENVRIGLEYGLRKLFTDYLDDVSTTYVDQNLLLANRGPEAVALAFRGNELKNGSTYPADGAKRGGIHKDWYYFGGLTASFRLGANSGGGSGSGFLSNKKGSKLGCPTKIY